MVHSNANVLVNGKALTVNNVSLQNTYILKLRGPEYKTVEYRLDVSRLPWKFKLTLLLLSGNKSNIIDFIKSKKNF